MDVIYLIYGLSFVGLGLAIVVRNERHSELALSRCLWLLAAFAFSHGLLEWTDLWNMIHAGERLPALAQACLLLVSYLFLFEFGRRLTLASLSGETRAHPLARLLSPWIYVPMAAGLLIGAAASGQPAQALGCWTRYLSGFPGSYLAGIGIYLYCHNRLVAESLSEESLRARIAYFLGPAAFIAYGIVSGLIVPGTDAPSAWPLDYERFQSLFFVPVQLPRAVLAAAIAYSIIVLLEVFERESQHRLRHALAVSNYSMSEIKRLNRHCQTLLDLVEDGMIGLDVHGYVNSINKAALAMFGVQSADVLCRPLRDLIGEAGIVLSHTAGDGPFPSMNDSLPGASTNLLRIQAADGNARVFQYKTTPLYDDGKYVGAVVLVRELAS